MRVEAYRKNLLALIILASGFASLGYQIIWTKQLGAAIGLDGPAILAIGSAIMGGFAIGAFFLSDRIRRTHTPFRTLATLELAIGIWGGVSLFLGRALPMLIRELPGADLLGNGLTFLVAIVAFLPSTVAMGATLPAMERAWKELTPQIQCLGLVYGINTIGATIGVISVAFLILPVTGLQTALSCMCILSLIISALLYFGFQSNAKLSTKQPAREDSSGLSKTALPLASLFTLGYLGMGTQLLFIRVLSQSLDNTVFTYASILSVYLLGTASGGLIYHRFQKRQTASATPIIRVVLATSLTIILSLYLAPLIPRIALASQTLLQGTGFGVMLRELGLAAMLLALPTFGSGFLFSAFVQTARQKTRCTGVPIGWNLLGATCAPMTVSLFIPTTGTRHLLLAIGLAYLLLARPLNRGIHWFALLTIGILAALAPSNFSVMGLSTAGVQDLSVTEGLAGTVSIVTDLEGNKRLEVNNHFMMGGTAAALSERRQAHLPLLLHPAPKTALFLGVGTGITIGAANDHPDLSSDGVELIPEILHQLDAFSEWNRISPPENRITLIRADARRYIKETQKQYDVVIADVFHPARDGAGLLYTQEHFEQIRRRLSIDGLFCQWLPLHQLDKRGFSSLLKTFSQVFNDSTIWLLDTHINLPVIALVGSEHPLANWEKRFDDIDRHSKLFKRLTECRLHSVKRLASCFFTNTEQLKFDVEQIPTNTDDAPFLSYHTPHIESHNRPYDLLATLLTERRASTTPAPMDGANTSQATQWDNFFRARDLYLQGQIYEDENEPSQAIEIYLEGTRTQPEFTLNYARSIRIASQFANTKPNFSIQILRKLQQIRPDEALASRLLERLEAQP